MNKTFIIYFIGFIVGIIDTIIYYKLIKQEKPKIKKSKYLSFKEINQLIKKYKRWVEKVGGLDEYYNLIVFLERKELLDKEKVKNYLEW